MNPILEEKLRLEEQYSTHLIESKKYGGSPKGSFTVIYRTIYPYCQAVVRQLSLIPAFERNYMREDVSLNDAVASIASDFSKKGNSFGVSDLLTMDMLVKNLMPGFSLNVSFMIESENASAQIVSTGDLYDCINTPVLKEKETPEAASINTVPDNAMPFVALDKVVEATTEKQNEQIKLF